MNYNTEKKEYIVNEEASKTIVWRMIIGTVLFFVAGLIIEGEVFKSITYLAAVLVLGYDIAISAVKKIFNKHFLNDELLAVITAATVFAIGDGPEATAVLLFYQIVRHYTNKASDKINSSLASIFSTKPDHANVERNGEIITVSPSDVHKGEVIVIKAGERIPLDGVVISGESFMDMRAITGDSIPISVHPGSYVMSGSINSGAPIYIKVSAEYNESSISKILKVNEQINKIQPKAEIFINKFVKYYTPIVTVIASALIIIMPLLDHMNFVKWIHRALVLLFVASPHILTLSVSLAFSAGTDCVSKHGILIKNKGNIEKLSKLETVVFDKTGTLTDGVFKINNIHSEDGFNNLLEYAAHAEFFSNHPISRAIIAEYDGTIDKNRISDYKETVGSGISVKIDGKNVLIGNIRLLTINGIYANEVQNTTDTVIYIAIDNKYAGYITVADKERPDSIAAVSWLHSKKINTIMMTGDEPFSSEYIANHVGINKVHSRLQPYDKIKCMEGIMARRKNPCAYVGDGINDASILSIADIGISMGAKGSSSAIDSSDIVLITDEPSKLIDVVSLSKRTMKIVSSNIVISIAVKLIIMLLGISGITGLWFAVFADTAISVFSVYKSKSILKLKK